MYIYIYICIIYVHFLYSIFFKCIWIINSICFWHIVSSLQREQVSWHKYNQHHKTTQIYLYEVGNSGRKLSFYNFMLNNFYFIYLCAQIIRASCESAHEETFLKNSFNCTSHFKFFFLFIINCARERISNLRYLRVYERNFSWIYFFLKKARFIRRNHWKLEIFAQ